MLFRKAKLWLLLWAALAGAAQDGAAGRFIEHVKVLTAEQMQGRAAGRPELALAADYIEQQFKSYGLRPPPGAAFRQAFPITAHASLGENNRAAYNDGSRWTSLKLDEDFRPLSFSASGHATGQVVFAGYGITAPEYGYDDYRTLDVRGKLVVVLRHEPQEFDENSIFSGRVYTLHGQLEAKALNARRHGALGVLFVADKPNHPSETALGEFTPLAGAANHGILFVEVSAAVVKGWLRLAGRSLEQIIKDIDRDLRPRSFALPERLQVDLTVEVNQQTAMVDNVMGYLEGATDEYLIIGAHYDHIGLGEQFSMSASGKGLVHPGADDNASGVAVLLELARWFSGQLRPRRGILFIAFAAEEIGLLGSNFYAENPVLPLSKAVAMINLDMVGRMRENTVYMGGIATGSGFRELVDAAGRRFGLKLDYSDSSGYGSSDQFSFLAKSVPVLFFYTGHHADYHTPQDTWDRLDAEASARLIELVRDIAQRLIENPKKPRLLRPSR